MPPGRSPQIDLVELQNMLQAGLIQKDCARHFNVSQAAVSKAAREIKLEQAKGLAIGRRVDEVTSRNLDVMAQLTDINRNIRDLLIHVTTGNGSKRKDAEYIRLKASKEIVGHLDMQLKILQMLYDFNAVKQFQDEVLETINSISPEVKERIVNALLRKRAIRAAVQMDLPPGYQREEE